MVDGLLSYRRPQALLRYGPAAPTEDPSGPPDWNPLPQVGSHGVRSTSMCFLLTCFFTAIMYHSPIRASIPSLPKLGMYVFPMVTRYVYTNQENLIWCVGLVLTRGFAHCRGEVTPACQRYAIHCGRVECISLRFPDQCTPAQSAKTVPPPSLPTPNPPFQPDTYLPLASCPTIILFLQRSVVGVRGDTESRASCS